LKVTKIMGNVLWIGCRSQERAYKMELGCSGLDVGTARSSQEGLTMLAARHKAVIYQHGAPSDGLELPERVGHAMTVDVGCYVVEEIMRRRPDMKVIVAHWGWENIPTSKRETVEPKYKVAGAKHVAKLGEGISEEKFAEDVRDVV